MSEIEFEKVVKEKAALEILLQTMDAKCKAYEELGSPEDINTLCDRVSTIQENFERLGSFDEIERALDSSFEAVQSYSKLGTPEEVTAQLEELETIKSEAAVSKLSASYNISSEAVEQMVESAGGNFELVEQLLTSTFTKGRKGRRGEFEEERSNVIPFKKVEESSTISAHSLKSLATKL